MITSFIIYASQSTANWVSARVLRLFQHIVRSLKVRSLKVRSGELDPGTGLAHGTASFSNATLIWQTAPESRPVEERYRLLPTDLGRTGRSMRIQNISYQGVENVRLVLHFAETHKALALDPTQCRDLIRSTGSGKIEEWLDRTVLLRVDGETGADVIRIEPAATVTSTPRSQLSTVLDKFINKHA